MSELEQIKKELAALQEKVAKMERAKDKPTEKWEPSYGNSYKTIHPDGSIYPSKHANDQLDKQRIAFGNAFPEDMPLDNVVMMYRFINEMELICWKLDIKKPASQSYPCSLRSKDEKICYVFDSVAQRNKTYSMLSYKVKDWLKME